MQKVLDFYRLMIFLYGMHFVSTICFILHGFIPEKASYGGFCSQNDQCTNSTVCKDERCTCKQGFVFIDTGCLKS